MESQPLDSCTPSGNPEKKRAGIGMPATLYLQQFGDIVYQAFGEFPYHVGSSLTGSTWRDVDVRLMLSDNDYAIMGFGDPKCPHENPKWCVFCAAFSELGRRMTNLPIDFQIQQTSLANIEHNKHRSSLFLCEIRRHYPNKEWETTEKSNKGYDIGAL